MHRIKSFLLRTFIILYAILCFSLAYFHLRVDQGHPSVSNSELEKQERVKVANDYYRIGPNWLRKNDWGLWEMHLEGNGYERGLAHGKLSAELMEYQEDAFVNKIFQLVPSESYVRFLRGLIAWFNRDIEENIPQEFKDEIYGISHSCNPKYNYIGPAYRRILNYHAAHDIGHALQNLALVGCTSFALHQNTSDSNMLIGRNFDFYVSDQFAENKIVINVKPDSGYTFTYISWASFIGVVSGMNEQGLTVTINAAKSEYPTKSAMPISLLAREILQYASNLDEAIAIAKTRNLFVSESIQVASDQDNRSIIIEKTSEATAVYSQDNSYLICANHFQSELLGSTETNQKDMAEGPSVYRFKRCEQLIKERPQADYLQVAEILRDTRGIDNQDIGMGNEKAMNQLISHHSIIFEPHKKRFWISTSPYQLGDYLAYNMDDFKAFGSLQKSLQIDSLRIPEDQDFNAEKYIQMSVYKDLKSELQTALYQGKKLENIYKISSDLISSNPNYYYTYMLIGDYFYEHKDFKEAKYYYTETLKYEIEHQNSRIKINKRIKEIEEQYGK